MIIAAVCCEPTQLILQVDKRKSIPVLQKFLSSEQQKLDYNEPLSVEPILDELDYSHFSALTTTNEAQSSLDELSRYFSVNLQQVNSITGENIQLNLQDRLLKLPFITAAYLKPFSTEAVVTVEEVDNTMRANQTPLFISKQEYLNGPGGFNVSIIRALPGGRGDNVTILDVERGWNFKHEDLIASKGKVVYGGDGADDYDHGTAVIGVLAGNENNFGIEGMTPKARILASAHSRTASADDISKAIIAGTKHLKAGDVMLIECQCKFPDSEREDDYIPIEFWPDNFHSLKLATQIGIIVVEAGANGKNNLDDERYYHRPKGFPKSWLNPFDRAVADSGCIIVGAGQPYPGTHNETRYYDRSRMYFSNYGSAFDAQGWGVDVTSLGYGDLFGKGHFNQLYTNRFSGTSSATPLVAGCIALIQSWIKSGGAGKERAVLTPQEVRNLLRTTAP